MKKRKNQIAPLVVILLGLVIIAAGVLEHDNQPHLVKVPMKTGASVNYCFTAHPILDYQVELAWVSDEDNRLVFAENAGSPTRQVFPQQLAQNFAHLDEKVKAHLVIRDSKRDIVDERQITPPAVLNSDGTLSLADTVVAVKTKPFERFTVTLTMDSVVVPAPALDPTLLIGFTPSASESNAVFPFMIGTLGFLIIAFGSFCWYLVIRPDNWFARTFENLTNFRP